MRLAVVQRPPVLLNRSRTIADAVTAIAEAASNEARLVVFPEAYIPGYPAWIWRLRPGADMALAEKLHALLLANAVSLDGNDLTPLREAAKKHKVTVVCGIDERDAEFSRGTLYNTVVVIGPDGDLLNRHRKLMPTNPERMVWGFGDASGLKVLDTPCGRIGTLICWENYMPLARCALYAQGVQIYIAPTYDSGDKWIGTLQHIAREGGCWVVGSGMAFRAGDIPDSVPGQSELYPDAEEWINPGDSVVIEPGGKIVAGPMRREVGILYAEVDLERVGIAQRSLDVVGHYSRPDIFQLRVNRTALIPVEFEAPQSAQNG
ncbi:carbon-nitrogen hydrolase family protein [Cyanobium sp. ATX 6A2]|uniref:carbon-nitrogen hydrolase family protein n=1 Tax=Cyanobium sp. ATX 6A2 TaxID=2823700 RepID=UPI0020CD67C6|nr:carbon-nitrogen hydrolase family protein [Cyanobium sp. ATX 6A2]MCP9887493.1 carbon-nitrogen hydrolase family protein [Cyanobium sp. ATX 6A2]